MMKNVNEMQLL